VDSAFYHVGRLITGLGRLHRRHAALAEVVEITVDATIAVANTAANHFYYR